MSSAASAFPWAASVSVNCLFTSAQIVNIISIFSGHFSLFYASPVIKFPARGCRNLGYFVSSLEGWGRGGQAAVLGSMRGATRLNEGRSSAHLNTSLPHPQSLDAILLCTSSQVWVIYTRPVDTVYWF